MCRSVLDRLQMRLAALHVCDELFLRSKHFRRLLMDNKFPIFVEQVVAPGKSLPAPKDAAKTLLEKALECIQQWNQRFSRHHVELTIAHTYGSCPIVQTAPCNGVDQSRLLPVAWPAWPI